MNVKSLVARRTRGQQLARPRFGDPAELVSWMGAMQAQDYAATKWAVGLRLRGSRPTDAMIARALDEGTLIRTHVFRWTWQLVTSGDARWMLGLVGARLLARTTKRHRDLEIDRKLMTRSQTVFEKALRRGDPLTREELGAELAKARIDASGPRLRHLVAIAELEGVVCNGARRGKEHTYTLLDLRAPAAKLPSRDEALATLALRYFQSHGPATMADFCWWTGLPPAECRGAVESIEKKLESELVDGQRHWFVDDSRKPGSSGAIELLPAFDEWLVAYKNREAVLEPKFTKRLNAGGGLLAPTVVQDGTVLATWRRTLGRAGVSLAFDWFRPPTASVKRGVQEAALRYAQFLGLPLAP